MTSAIFIEGVNFGSKTITWPVGIRWSNGSQPAFTASGTDLIAIFRDAAGNLTGTLVIKDFR